MPKEPTRISLLRSRFDPFLVAASIFLLLSSSCGRQPASSPGEASPETTSAHETATPQDPAHYDFSVVEKILEEAAPQLGGCALVLIKDGSVIYQKAFGRFSVDKVVPIASASKWLSGAVILSLVEDGKLSLDDPISKYLPEFEGEKSNITIRQLFSHTSGLPPEAPCRNNKQTSLKSCAEEIARLKLRANPGEEFYYGGVSMHAGGRIAEIAGGKPWNELFIERIASPLGMTDTDFFAYGRTDNPRPEGDARSSAEDYARFLQMIINQGEFGGGQLLSAESLAEMHRDQTAGARIGYTIYEKHGRLDPELPRARYGIGVWREKIDESTGELLEASSQGALGFSPWIDVRRKLAGVLSVQSSMSRVMPVYLRLKEEVRRVVPESKNKPILR